MAQAEKHVLQCLKNDLMPPLKSLIEKFSKIKVELLFQEMSARQKLIYKEGDSWKITKFGQELVNFSDRSEKK